MGTQLTMLSEIKSIQLSRNKGPALIADPHGPVFGYPAAPSSDGGPQDSAGTIRSRSAIETREVCIEVY